MRSNILIVFAFLFSMVYGQNNYSLSFNGVDDYLDCGNDASLNITDSLSIEFWVKIYSADTNPGIVCKNSSGNIGWYTFIATGNDSVVALHGGVSSGVYFNFIHGSKYSKNQWKHYAFIYTNGRQWLYEDGALVHTDSSTYDLTQVSNNLFIGKKLASGASRYFNGLIDEVRIWDRAISQSDIQSNMHKELSGTESGLVGYWNFNDGVSTIASDQSSNGNNGTIHGAIWSIDVPHLSIVSLYPSNNAIDISNSTNISVTFNNGIDFSSISDSTFTIHGSQSGLRAGSYSYNSSTKTISFDPNNSFYPNEIVEITLTTGIMDSNGSFLSYSYVWSFTTEVTGGDGVFQNNVDYSSGEQPFDVYPADIDGDGDIDITVTNYAANSVSVLLNNGDGTFQAKVDYTTGNNPISLYLSDLDNDTDLDIAVTNFGSTSISIILNNGDGTFQSRTDYPIGSEPHTIVSGDFDGDGDLDIAASNTGDSNVSVLLNNGDGTLQSKIDYSTGLRPHGLIAADFDNDGDVDLSTANVSGNTISVLLNNGSGTFLPKIDFSTGYYPYRLVSADMDVDGDIDIIVSRNKDDLVTILYNAGDGTFQNTSDYPSGDGPASVSSADFDGDNDMDLIVTNNLSNNVSLLINGGNGLSFTKTDYLIGDTSNTSSPADFDGDGDIDLVVTNFFNHTISILLNESAPLNPQNLTATPGNQQITLRWKANSESDLTKYRIYRDTSSPASTLVDSNVAASPPDTFYTNTGLTNGTTYHYRITAVDSAGNESGYSNEVSVSPNQFTKITDGNIVNDGGNSSGGGWADYDDDGDLDIVVTNAEEDQYNFFYSNNGDGTFLRITSGIIATDLSMSYGISWGDYDNDGLIDLFISNTWDRMNFLYHNEGSDTFSKINTGEIVTDQNRSASGIWVDYNNDGFLDMFVSNGHNNDQVNCLYKNNRDGSFTKISSGAIVTDETSSTGSSWADYDNDGDFDVFVANNWNQNNLMYENNGDGTFTKILTGNIVNDNAHSHGASWGDYDNDGDLDLFVTNGSNQNNLLYNNNGDGTFMQVTSGIVVTDGGDWSGGSSWGDYDNDGYLDLFVANGDGENNFLYHNNGNMTFNKITTGPIVSDGGESGGCAWGDIDNDGDLDLFVANTHSDDTFLYINNGNDNNWINIHCIGTISNKSAIGSKVFVKASINGNNMWQIREISGQTGGDGQNSLSVEFGLGNANIIDSLRINWPSGIVWDTTNVQVNQFLIIIEPGEDIFAPTVPQNLTATPGNQQVTLRWDQNTESDLHKYNIYRDTSSPASTLIDSLVGTPPDTFFTDLGLSNGQTYYYRITAVDSAGNESGFSDEVFSAPTLFQAVTTNPFVNDIGVGGGGLSWGDYDNDGDLDLFASSGFHNNVLYNNDGNGNLTEVTTGPIVAEGGHTIGGSWGDYDNDGYLDLFVANEVSQVDFLYHNNGDGTFTKVTTGPIVTDGVTSYGGSWADYDNDGDLDLFVTHIGYNNLYTNDGYGNFTAVSDDPIVTDGPSAHSATGSWGDYNNDGNIDLFVANDPNNCLYRNNGDATFTKITSGAIVTDGGGSYCGSWADYNNDGYLDLFVANALDQDNYLYENNRDGTFTKVTTGSIVSDGGWSHGCGWADYNNDGYVDLFVANYNYGNNFSYEDFLYTNNGDGTFTRLAAGPTVADSSNSKGVAWADFDKDGDMDLFITTGPDQNNLTYINGGTNNNWVNIKVVNANNSTSVIGARVHIKAALDGTNSTWQMKEVTSLTGWGSHGSFNTEFGLGSVTIIDSITVSWPSGRTWDTTNVSVNQFLVIKEPLQQTGLIAYYPFNGNVSDTSGNEYDGVEVGGITYTADRFEDENSAISFNGDFDLVELPYQVLNSMNEFSISLWLKTTGDAGTFISAANSSDDNEFLAQVRPDTNSVAVSIKLSGVDGDRVLADDKWHHFVLNRDTTGVIQTWIDETIDINYEGNAGSLVVSDGGLWLGNDQDNVGGGWSSIDQYIGLIDDIRIYNRVLSISEIDSLHHLNGWPAPAAPQSLTATPGNQQITLRWDANTEIDLAKYLLYRDTSSPATTLIDSCVATSPPDTFYTDTGLTNEQTYYYRITAVDSAGNESGYSNEVSVTTYVLNVSTIIPDNGIVGTNVTIYGTGFSAVPTNNIVKFGNIFGSVISSTTSTLNVNIPADATGLTDVIVAVGGDIDTCAIIYTVLSSGSGIFQHSADYTAGNTIHAVNSVDYNCDGFNDIAAVNSYSNTVSVFLNAGDGTFPTKVDYETGNVPAFLHSADLNDDSYIDLAIANSESDDISILINNRNGSFQSKIDYPAGDHSESVICTDLNGDAKIDLVSANHLAHTLSVFMNNGDGTFQVKQDYATGQGPITVIAADFDSDGDMDIVNTNENDNSISVLLNNGFGVLQSALHYSAGTLPFRLRASDFDSDGDVDIVTANNAAHTISVLLNNGDATFQGHVEFATGSNLYDLISTDLDADGDVDIAAGNRNSYSISVWLNNGDATFQARMDNTTDIRPFAICTSDLDNDGDMDVITGNYSDNNVSVYLNINSDLVPGVPQNLTATHGNQQITLRWDQNTESDLAKYRIYRDISSPAQTLIDSVVSSSSPDTFYTNTGLTNGQTYYYRVTAVDNAGNESGYSDEVSATPSVFTRITEGDIVNDGEQPYSSNWGDYDNDGYLDLFVANGYNGNNFLYQNNGDGTFTKVTTGNVVTDGENSNGSSWGDYDNDDDLDLFVANYDGGNNFLYQNNGDGTFTKVTTGNIVTEGGNSVGSSWGDYDNDGDLDIFVANGGGENNFLYQNNGDGTFSKITTGNVVTDGGNSYGNSWCDYDNNGYLDLFVANRGDNNFLYRNNGDGTFTKITTGNIVTDGAYSQGGSWGDYDNDGDLDLFVTNSLGGNNFLYQNNADGTFTKVTAGNIVTDGGNSQGSSWGDYDNDGDLDLFVANYNQNNFLYRNNGDETFTKIMTGNIVTDGNNSRGCSWGDYNSDGNLDIFVANSENQNSFLYQNNGSSNNWINLKCVGTVSNKSAIGTKVRVKAIIGSNTIWQMQEVSGQTGWEAQNSLVAEFGLGNAINIDSIKIEWPSGIVWDTANISINQFLTIRESPDVTPPSAPQNLTATPSNQQISLRWNQNTESDLAKYRIYRGTSSPAQTIIDSVVSLSSPDTFYTDVGLTNGQTYYYRITAVDNARNESVFSNEVNTSPRPKLFIVNEDGTGNFTVIQTAIDASTDGDTVLVYPGTYVENINFNGHNIVVGSLFLTTQDTSYISSTIIDGGQTRTTVTINSGENSSCEIFGLSVRNGGIAGYDDGGGIFCNSASPTLSHLIVRDNIAADGGGVKVQNSSAHIYNCIISNNQSYSGGGAIYCGNSTDVIISNCSLFNNNASGDGGGIRIENDSEIYIENCNIFNNQGDGGGGLGLFYSSEVTIINSNIYNNNGGGFGGGFVLFHGSTARLINNILFWNTPDQLFFDFYGAEGDNVVAITFCNIEGGVDDIQNELNNSLLWMGGNIQEDPLFVDPSNEDFHLSDYSPCIGTGIDSIEIEGIWYYTPTTDIDGNPRPNPVGSTPDIGAYENTLETPSAPPAPTNLAATAGNGLADLTWTGNQYSTSYSVYRSTTSGSGYSLVTNVGDTTAYTNTGLTNDTIYYYVVTATGAGGESGYSSEVNATPKRQLYTVKTDGTGDYTVIQTAIDATTDGDTVLVHPGTYVENINFNGYNIVVGSLLLTTLDTSYISSTIIDGNQNGSVVTFESGEDSTTILCGFTITNGNASEHGGGIYCNHANPHLTNLIIQNNISASNVYYWGGGGIYLMSSSPTITSTIIRENTVTGAWKRGGGLSCYSYSNPTISNTIISSNRATDGAGIALYYNSNPVLTNVLMHGNKATNIGGGIFTAGQSCPQLTNVTLSGNIAHEGGGMVMYDDLTIPVLTNSIVWGNQPEDIVIGGGAASGITASYSNIGNADDITSGPGIITWGTGNLDGDPLFVDTTNNEYHLSNYSIAIGTGTSTGAPTTDIDGNPRPNPSGSSPDMGAFENTLATPLAPPAPTNLTATAGNGIVNLTWVGNQYSTSYYVYRSTTSGSSYSLVSNVGDTTAFTNTGLANDSTYYFVVSATGAGGESGYSSEVSATPERQLYTVKKDGSGDFTVIQTAIDVMTNGDTVLVQPGTYIENINFNGHNIVVGSLFLTTQDTSYISATFIDGNQSGSVVTFESGEDSTAILSGMTITNGSATYGGGIHCSNSHPILSYLNIIGNSSPGADGGGIYAYQSDLYVLNCIISNNSVIGNGGGATFLFGSPTLENLLIADNNVTDSGGGIAFRESSAKVNNVTITENSVGNYGSGIYCYQEPAPHFENTIIWGDTGANEIFTEYATITANFCNIAGGWQGEGNIDSDPLFVDPTNGNYRLSDYSPSIGAGTDSIQIDGTWYYAPAIDIDGNPRPNPAGSNPDMGTFESPLPSQRPKANGIADGLAYDIDWTNSSTSLSANWEFFTDDSTVIYEYAIGSSISSLNDVKDWTNAGTDTSVTTSGLNLIEGNTYYCSVRGTDIHSQLSDTATTDGITVDLTLPVITTVYEGHLSSDRDYQNQLDSLIISWTGSDDASGIACYEYALGTSSGGTETVGWTACGLALADTLTSLSLVEGTTYYLSVRGMDVAGNISSIITGDGIQLDATAPLAGEVNDGAGDDIVYTGSDNNLSANWAGFSDNASGIAYYEYAIGTTTSGTDVVTWKNVGSTTNMDTTGLSLNNGQIYYVSIRATDHAGNISQVATTDGVIADLTGPLTGTVIDGLEADLDWTNSTTTLSGKWSGFSDELSGIDYYEYAIGLTSGDSDLVSWSPTGLDTTFNRMDQSLNNSQTYYVSIRAEDNVGNRSVIIFSDGITVDTVLPIVNIPTEGGLVDLDYQNLNDSLIITWSGSDDASGIAGFEYALGTTPGSTNTINWINANLTESDTISGLNLIEGLTYYAGVRANDIAGNTALVVSGDGITIDLTAPVTGIIIDGIDNDQEYSGSDSSLTFSWSGFSDAVSGLWKYQYCVGTISGGTDVLNWVDLIVDDTHGNRTDSEVDRSGKNENDQTIILPGLKGSWGLTAPVTDSNSRTQDSTLTIEGLTLTNGTIYFISLRAEDNATNVSTTVSTDGVTIDTAPPSTGIVWDGTDADSDWTNVTSQYSARWSGFSDALSGIDYYEYSLGTTGGSDNVFHWTNSDTVDTAFIGSLTLNDGVSYYFNVRATDQVGNRSESVSSNGLTIDLVQPTIDLLYEGSNLADQDFQANNDSLLIFWAASDNASGIASYEYAVGTTAGASDVTNWSENGLETEVTTDLIGWSEGDTYFAAVRVTDIAGNLSVVTAGNGITPDLSGPAGNLVFDGLNQDLEFSDATNTLDASWDVFTDSLSGVQEYEYQLGTTPGGDEEISWISTGTDTFITTIGLSLTDAQSYYHSVRAIDNVSNLSAVYISDGITIDHSPPITGVVNDGLGEDEAWTNSDSTLELSWTGFHDVTSGIQYFEYAVGTVAYSDNFIGWTDVGVDTFVIDTSRELSHGVTYYGSVRATDKFNHLSTVASSNGITVDIFEPTVGVPSDGGVTDLDYQADSTRLTIAWTGNDTRSLDYFLYSVGDSPGDTSTIPWTNAGSQTSITATGLNLEHAVTYYANVMAYDEAGNISQVASSDGITIDLYPPSLGTVIDGLTQDLDYTASQTSLSASWDGFSDTTSGIQFYEYAIGTTPGSTDLKTWTNVGTDLNMTANLLALNHATDYYVSIRVTDNVQNMSDWVASNGIITDHFGPVGYWALDGDSVDIDFSNNNTEFYGKWQSFTDTTSGLSHYQFALYDENNELYEVTWQANSLDTTVSFTGLELTEGHQYTLKVRGIDNVANTGSIITSDGVVIDMSPPAAPQNLVGYFSTNRIYLTWDQNQESDLVFYSVYDTTGVILQSTTNEAEAFVDGFQNGNLYELKVTATDLPGNESIFSNSVSGVPQEAQITRVIPRESHVLSASEKELAVHFSHPLNDIGTVLCNSTTYPTLNYDSEYNSTDTSIVITINDPHASLDTIDITLSGILDWANNSTTTKELQFITYMLADYDTNMIIDVVDLTYFVDGWTNVDYTYELGPVTGSVPHLISTPNTVYDLDDIMAFTRMWNWSHQQLTSYMIAASRFGESPEITQEGGQLIITMPAEAQVGQFAIQYSHSVSEMQFNNTESSGNKIFLKREEPELGQLLVEYAYLKSNTAKQIVINTKSLTRDNTDLILIYQMYTSDKQLIGSGSTDFELIAIPDKFALHQNYPNPFNPITTINYDLPEDGQVNLAIYDILGRQVIQLTNGFQEAGYKSIRWNGRNKSGQVVSASMYFYAIETGKYSAIRKMVLLK